jgi:hypothetical protein
MQVSKLIATLAAAAFAALLAGCGGASQLATAVSISGGAAQSLSPKHSNGLHTPTVVPLLAGEARTEPSGSFVMSANPPPNAKCTSAFLFANDNTTGNVDMFCEDGTHKHVLGKCIGCGGWGLAVSPVILPGELTENLAIGKSGGTITVWRSLPTPVLVSTLTLGGASAGANALGICFDGTGGLYATNYPTNEIDYFAIGKVLGPGGGPTRKLFTTTITQGFWLACDFDTLVVQKQPPPPSFEDFVMLSGLDSSLNALVASVNLFSGADTTVQTLGNWTAGTGFPGGLTINKNDVLVADNQFGKLLDLGTVEPWNLPASSVCTWGYFPHQYYPIVFDDTQLEIWAGDLNHTGSAFTQAISNTWPFPNNSPCPVPGESGPRTPPIPGEKNYLGVAVYPNNGV